MAELTEYSVQGELGCGFIGGIFQRWSYLTGKATVHSLPTKGNNNSKKPPTHNSKRRRSSSVDSALLDSSSFAKPSPKPDRSRHSGSADSALLDSASLSKPSPKPDRSRRSGSAESASLDSSSLAKPSPKGDQKSIRIKPNSIPPRPSNSHKKNNRRPSDASRSSTSSSSSSTQMKVSVSQSQIQVKPNERKQLKEYPTCNSTELTKVVTTDHQGKVLVRATSSNIMLMGRLGNLRQMGTGTSIALGNNSPNATTKTVDYLYKNIHEVNSIPKPKYGYSKLGSNGVMGNIVRQHSVDQFPHCRGSMNGLDSEVLKSMGNEAYKQGKFEEALALYDRAIALNSDIATYRSNRSAALIGLGRLIEAVVECKEAIRIDPSYHRAHYRLATLYRRLGEAEKALIHYKQSGSYANSEDISQAQALQNHLSLCVEARKLKEWNILLKETQSAISLGADSAPQVYALQAEALLQLHKHQEAYATYRKGPNFTIDSCTKFFGLAGSARLLMIEARVYMAVGRFEDAVAAAQNAAHLDPSNKEVIAVAKRARAAASARLSGNLLFKASKFSEACIAYTEGLEHDPHNSILLSNRAACRSKLRQFEKAIEDCTAALNVRPSYSKARLRRADCNATLERWESSVQDYEMLIRETPGDEEVGWALFEAQVQLKKLRGEDVKDMKFGSNLVLISSNEHFRNFVTSPGMSVVLFCNKAKHKQVMQLMEQVCKRYPSVNFLKVVVEDHPYLAKSEGVSSIPAFKIYRNGTRVKEIPANNHELLESSVKLYSTSG